MAPVPFLYSLGFSIYDLSKYKPVLFHLVNAHALLAPLARELHLLLPVLFLRMRHHVVKAVRAKVGGRGQAERALEFVRRRILCPLSPYLPPPPPLF
jgi:hypothetical protein